MTIGGALSDLDNLLKADDIPFYYKPSIKAVMDTIALSSPEKPINSPTETLISLDVYKQVAWERDIAIEQLHELGYEFGQKIEPATKNDLALIHTWGLDEEIRCTMCTNSMKSDRGCDGSCVVNNDMYKAVMDAIEKRIQPTAKNDLAVDYTINGLDDFIEFGKKTFGVELTIKKSNNPDTYEKLFGTTKNDLGAEDKPDEFEEWKLNEDKDCYLKIGDILDRFKEVDEHYNYRPWNLTQIFSNLNILPRVECKDCISRAEVLKIFDEWFATCDIADKKDSPKIKIKALPPVIPIRPKGHWIDTKENSTNTRGQIIHEVICSECNGIAYFRSIGNKYIGANICPNCNADMREVVEE